MCDPFARASRQSLPPATCSYENARGPKWTCVSWSGGEPLYLIRTNHCFEDVERASRLWIMDRASDGQGRTPGKQRAEDRTPVFFDGPSDKTSLAKAASSTRPPNVIGITKTRPKLPCSIHSRAVHNHALADLNTATRTRAASLSIIISKSNWRDYSGSASRPQLANTHRPPLLRLVRS